ncbi:hypothetical protein LCGC14_1557350 [marine sediment metagenome]|uniref:Uncharacterized protein n=1 Tax=marine sediment metagenome TaxID=412755 RepID=A0A0F9INH9_9ZZZZ
MRLLIEKIELRISGIERRLWVIIALLIISLLFATKGALTGILMGFTTLEVTHTMEPLLIFALVAGVGSLFRGYLGFLKAKEKGAIWDWQMALISVGPVLVAALGSAQFMALQPSVTNMILVFFGAAGMNSLQDKFGLQKRSKA